MEFQQPSNAHSLARSGSLIFHMYVVGDVTNAILILRKLGHLWKGSSKFLYKEPCCEKRFFWVSVFNVLMGYRRLV